MWLSDCVEQRLDFYTEGWTLGPPRGILFHYTAGCGDLDQVYQTYLSRRVSAHFTVARNPKNDTTRQHVALDNRSWHAFNASDYYYGIEHVALPGNCNLTVPQLIESSRISAEIIKFVKQNWDVTIPIVRSPGCEFTPGFKQHSDGLGCDWNPNGHVDGLVQTWTWPQYLASVQQFLEGDEFMALFDTIEDFRKEVRKALGGVNDDGNPALSQTEIRNSLEFICGMNIRMEGSQMPDATSLPKQNGWKFADKMLEEAADNDNFPTMGELTGVITLKS